jgi:hypothetical protein
MVQFNDVHEFLENLDKDRDLVERRIVRVTNLYRQSKLTASIQHLSVLATARISGEIVRLEVYCGDLWNLGSDQATLEKASGVQRTVTDECARLNLDVRVGLITDANQAT